VVAAEPPSPEPPAPAGPQAGGARAEAAAGAGLRAAAGAQSPVVPPSHGAAYLRNPAPRYPAEARREGAEGTVLLRVWVAADGGPTRVEVERSSGHRALDAAAMGAVRNWRFVPAQRGGEAVEGIATVPLVFRLDSGG
jgi:protein TonB